MNIVEIMEKFKCQEDCIKHLEYLRFNDKPYCPLCEGYIVSRKNENDKIGRWNCYECRSSFNVLSGTIFSGTRTPLIKWFLAIAIVIASRKGVSSYQLARYLGISQDNAWRMLYKIRLEMLSEMNGIKLRGIVEADETYASIKTGETSGIGRGSNKLKILGAVEREGSVKAQRVYDVTGDTIKWFMESYLDYEESVLITDQWRAYHIMDDLVEHLIMDKTKERYKTTSVIEGFWATVKRSIYGTYHHYKEYNADLYLAEICFRYNNRMFEDEDNVRYFIKHIVFKHSNISYHLVRNGWML